MPNTLTHQPARLALGMLAMLCLAWINPTVWAHTSQPHGADPQPNPAQPNSAEAAAQAAETALALDPRLTDRLSDEFTPDADKLNLVVFHGLITQAEAWLPAEITWPPDALAFDALTRGDLTHASLTDEQTHPLRRAKFQMMTGDFKGALESAARVESLSAQLMAAECVYALGDHAQASTQLKSLINAGNASTDLSAEDLRAMGRASLLYGEWAGVPSAYQQGLNLLGRARNEADPLYWPAYIEEAVFLLKQSQVEAGVGLLTQAIQLNPSCAEAWYWLGRMNLSGQRHEVVDQVLDQLDALRPETLWAKRLRIEQALAKRAFSEADLLIETALLTLPTQPDLLTQNIASAVLQANDTQTREALNALDQVQPNHPSGYLIAGEQLSSIGHFEAAHTQLITAAERAPTSSLVHSTLGYVALMLDQPKQAAHYLTKAVKHNPYDIRAKNRLTLAEAIESFATIETDHFIIRYRPGVDEAFARDLARDMEAVVYPSITQRFGHEPAAKTGIEIMPDQDWFAVRLTGLPDFWTFAAAVGNVIVVSPPRHGKNLKGTYDWLNVLTHEFTHTVTLDMTNRRVPRWFTEGAAVNMELPGRAFGTCQRLAAALKADQLLPLSDINRPFINPQRADERSLAYAQSSWLVEYIESRGGTEAIAQLHKAFADQKPVQDAILAVLGLDADAFMDSFKTWAQQQVRQWGLDEPELLMGLRVAAEQALTNPSLLLAQQAIQTYEDASPHDPWVHQARLQLAEKTNNMQAQIAALTQIDRIQDRVGTTAYTLAKMHQQANHLQQAKQAVARAIHREPYNGNYRELAALIDLQLAAPEDALIELKALTLIEPEQSVHWARYAALLDQLGRTEEAQAARKNAQ